MCPGVSAISCNSERMNFIAVAQIFIQICLYQINGCQSQRSGDIRLVGGASSIEGRVEVYFGGRWGTICDDLWNDKAATVVCRQLGLGDNGTAVFQAEFGRGRGTIWLDNVECSGSESNLQECSYPGLGLHNCDHTEDAGVYCIKDGEIRLTNGLSSNDGRVEIFHDGQWGTVCDNGWDDTDAVIVCRQLGFNSTANAFGSATFGQGSDMIWLANVECTGSEHTLRECTNTGWNKHSCTHYEDAGVRCDTDEMDDGISGIRLRNGFSSNEGRVEVFHDGQWGTVCDDSWDDTDATVVCRQLGFNGTASAFWSARFGQGRGPIWLDNVECNGMGQTLQECTNPGWGVHNCDHSEDAGVRCVADGLENEIILTDGLSPSEGRVEVFHDGQWGTVCDDDWNDTDATVVCRQLGFNGTAAAFGSAIFGQGSGPIWLDNVECNGTEDTLLDCTNPGWGVHNCDHNGDASVRCELVPENEVRLNNGFSSNNGRVEIFHDGQWGTVCDDGWDDSDAAVVCRQLGFQGSGAAYLSAAFGPGRGTIWLDNVECIGNELSLVECTNPGWGVQNCNHHEDAGVRCDNDDTENVLIRLVGGSSHNEGRVEVYINGRWGTVCGDDWDDKDAVVVCRQLGLNTGGTAVLTSAFGKGSGEILLDDVHCSGEEEYLIDCRSTRRDNCDHGEEAGVRCNDIRLTYGVGMSEGRVEVYYDGQWGTVCDDSWNNVETQVVCRQLGFSPGGTAVLRSFFGSTATRMRLHDIRCTGKETSLLHCENSGWSNEKCHSAEDVGVSCTEDTKSCFNVPCLNGGTCITQSYGYICVCLNGFYGNTCEIEKPGISTDKPKGFAIFISFVCLLLVGAIVYLAVWIRRIKYSLDSQALSPIAMQKRNTDNKSVESNRNEYKRREMSNIPSENSEDLYVNEELYEAV